MKARTHRTINIFVQRPVPFIVFLVTVMSFGCSSRLELSSRWRDRTIAVDGKDLEWHGAMTFVEKENVSVGFFNDTDYLYVSLTTPNRAILRQFMARGFTIWFDPDGGREREFGIRFPLGLMKTGLMMRNREQRPDRESLREHFEKSLVSLEIISPEEEAPRMVRVDELKGLEIKIGDPRENLVYEIKVPLRKDADHPYAIEAKTDNPIGVGFETAKIDLKALREGRGPDRVGGGRGGGRPGFGGRRGGRRGGGGKSGIGRPPTAEPFELWVAVRLGSEEESASARIMMEEKDLAQPLDEPRPQRPGERESDDAPKSGEVAPTFKLTSLDGKGETDLASFRGEKPVVLFFGSYT